MALIFGETADELGRELARFEGHLDGTFDLAIEAEGPFMRALLRAEAELLVADALAMQVGTYTERTPNERRADALAFVISRMHEHLRAA